MKYTILGFVLALAAGLAAPAAQILIARGTELDVMFGALLIVFYIAAALTVLHVSGFARRYIYCRKRYRTTNGQTVDINTCDRAIIKHCLKSLGLAHAFTHGQAASATIRGITSNYKILGLARRPGEFTGPPYLWVYDINRPEPRIATWLSRVTLNELKPAA